MLKDSELNLVKIYAKIAGAISFLIYFLLSQILKFQQAGSSNI